MQATFRLAATVSASSSSSEDECLLYTSFIDPRLATEFFSFDLEDPDDLNGSMSSVMASGTELVACNFCLVCISSLSICCGDISLVSCPMTSMPLSEMSFSRFFSSTCRSAMFPLAVFEQYP